MLLSMTIARPRITTITITMTVTTIRQRRTITIGSNVMGVSISMTDIALGIPGLRSGPEQPNILIQAFIASTDCLCISVIEPPLTVFSF